MNVNKLTERSKLKKMIWDAAQVFEITDLRGMVINELEHVEALLERMKEDATKEQTMS